MQGLGCRVQRCRGRVPGLGGRVQGLGLRVPAEELILWEFPKIRGPFLES